MVWPGACMTMPRAAPKSLSNPSIQGTINPDPWSHCHNHLLHTSPIDLLTSLSNLSRHLGCDLGIFPPGVDQDILSTSVVIKTPSPTFRKSTLKILTSSPC